MTVSPDYSMKGVPNPYYTVEVSVSNSVKVKLKTKKIKDVKELLFKCVKKPNGENINPTSKGKFIFQLVNKVTSTKELSLPYYVTLTAKQITGHYGSTTRKDSTASSNVNEYLTVFFIKNGAPLDKQRKLDVKVFMETISKAQFKNTSTGIYTGEEEEITFGQLNLLVDKDETPERDIEIGYNNAIAVKKDLAGSKIKKLYWTPRKKPGNVSPKNPSDVVVQLENKSYVGYSNKIAGPGEDVTPKFNTNITAYYSKLEDSKQLNNIEKIIDKSWTQSANMVSSKNKNAYGAIQSFDISKELFSESASKQAFSNLSKSFSKDKLNFYAEGFYYLFRNNLIENFAKYLTAKKNQNEFENFKYFLKTIYFYTYDDPRQKFDSCPYKLLVGRVGQPSTLKSVSDNKNLQEVLINDNDKIIKDLSYTYDGNSQSFSITFKYIKTTKDILNVVIPITMRTRASGGWSGKSLYINTSGVKITQ